MRFQRFWVLLLLLSFCRLDHSLGQEVNALIKIAENHYKNESYFKAANFYLKALDIQPGNITALYKLAESYRNITNYHSAEYYYEQVIQKSVERYPLSLYYYALTQKFNGKYEEALNNFQSFIANVEAGRYQRLRANTADVFSEQARIEREGCLLALKELSKPVQDHGFAILTEPVNSVNNDYAPYIYQKDSTIIVTSTRAQSKGGNFDDKFGESLSDVFRYELRGETWRKASDTDRFERFVNSKFHDGSGVFNSDFTSFYYTHCDETNCKIYVTKNVDGKWVEGVALNNNINPSRSDSRHPSLTPRGDTLFFVSNRPGGMGGNDIWMSIAGRENSWGPAKNLGDHINTAFDEISPFYDSKERALFFASNGHKGHGGLDIFLAEKIFDPRTELYNMGLPYNSSRDDAFFVLGEKIGFLASNRDGGLGKFDIYSFMIESDEEIIMEILNFKEVASRNSLFSSDYEFDNTDRDKIEEIISHQLASRLHGINMSLTDDELVFFNTLSEADKSRIERIVNTRLKAISNSNIITVRHEDEFFYQQLSSDFKYHVDKMVTLYLEDYEVAPAVSIEQQDKAFYESLNTNAKEKVDRYIALKLDEYEDLNLGDQYYSSLDPASQSIVDDISVDYLRSKSNLTDVNLSTDNLNFLNSLDEAERAQTELSIANQVASISNLPEFDLGDGEQIFYRNLTGDEKSSLDNIAQAYIQASVDNLGSFLNPTDLAVYNNLTPIQKESFDKILAKRIQNFIKADKYQLDVFDERDLIRLTELQLTGEADLNDFLSDEDLADDSPLKLLAQEDPQRFARLLSSASNLVMMNTSSKLKEVALSVERGQDIEQLIDNNENDLVASLQDDERGFYNSMSSEETAIFDQVLKEQLNTYVDSSESFLGNNYNSNPGLVPRLEQRLNRDLDITSILSQKGDDQQNSVIEAMDPQRVNLMNKALASSAKHLLVNNTPEFQEMANRNVLSPQFIAQMSNTSNPALQLASRPQVNANNPNLSSSATSFSNYQGLAAAPIVTSLKGTFLNELPPSQQQIYNNLTAEDQQFIDQALSIKLQDYVDGNNELLDIGNNPSTEQALAFEDELANDLNLENLLSDPRIQTPGSIRNKSGNERFVLSGLLTNAAKSIISNAGPQLQNLSNTSASSSSIASTNSTSSLGNPNSFAPSGSSSINTGAGVSASLNSTPTSQAVANLVSNARPTYTRNLNGSELSIYNNLSPTERQYVDDALTNVIATYSDSNSRVLDLASSPDSQDQQIVDSILRTDFSLDNLSANGSSPPPSLTSRSANFQNGLSSAMASMARSVITNNGETLRSISDSGTTSAVASNQGNFSTSQGVNPTATLDFNSSSTRPSPSARSTNPVTSGIPTVANLVERSRGNYTRALNGSQQSVYNNLSLEERHFVDEALSEVLTEYVSNNSRVIELAQSNDPQYAEIVNSKLNSDFSISKINQRGTITLPASINNRPANFQTGLSSAMASMARSVITNNPAEFRRLTTSSVGSVASAQPISDSGSQQNNPAESSTNTGSTVAPSNALSPSIRSTQPVTSGSQEIARLIEGSRGNYTGRLNGSQQSIYNNLTLEERHFVDEALSEVISGYVNNNSRVVALAGSNDPQYTEIVNSKLNNDFAISKLNQNNTFPLPSSINSHPPGFQADLSSTMATMARSVMTNRAGELQRMMNTNSSGASLASNAGSSLPGNAVNSSVLPSQNNSFQSSPGISLTTSTEPVTSGAPDIANLVESSRNNYTRALNGSEKNIYNNLSLEEKQYLDEALSQVISNYSENNSRVIELAGSSDPQYQEIVSSKLASDFSVENLAAIAGLPPSSLTNRSEAFKQQLASTVAGMAQSIMADNTNQLGVNTPSRPSESFVASASGNSGSPDYPATNSNPNGSISSYSPTLPASVRSRESVSSGLGPVANLVEGSRSRYTRGLNPQQQSIYNNLSLEERHFVDEALSSNISNYVNQNSRVLELVNSADPQDQEIVNAKLASDFSSQRLNTNSVAIPASITDRTPNFQAGLSQTMASIAKNVMTSNSSQLRQIAGPNLASRTTGNQSPSINYQNQYSSGLGGNGSSPSTSGSTTSFNSGSSFSRPSISASGTAVSKRSITSGSSQVAGIVQGARPTYTNRFNGSQENTYRNLSLEEKHFMDEALSNVITSYVEDNSRIFDLVRSTDPQDLELVQAKLSSDFSLNKLVATSSAEVPASLTNRPLSFRSSLSSTIASMARSVLSDKGAQLSTLSPAPKPTLASNNVDNRSFDIVANTSLSESTLSINYDKLRVPPANSLSEAFTNANSKLETSLKGDNLVAYNALSPDQKNVFNEIVKEKLVSIYRQQPNALYAFATNNDRAIQNGLAVISQNSDVSLGKVANSVSMGSKLSPQEKEELSRLLASSISSSIAKNGPQLKSTLDKFGPPNLNTSSGTSFSSYDSPFGETPGTIYARVNPERRKNVSITEDDYNYYYNLDPEKRKMIDKVVALRIVNEFAVKEKHDLRKDKAYLDGLETREKRSVKRLARFLDGDNMNDIKVNIVQEDLNYYDNLSNRKKDDVNRLIVGDVFNFTSEHNIYGVKGSDQAVLSTLNPREKELFHLLHNIRSRTHNVFGNRLDLERTIVESESIIEEVKSFDNKEFETIEVSGSLFAIDGGRPLGNFSLSLVDKNGNVIVSTRTTSNGEFNFKNVQAKGNYTIQSSEGDLTSRAKDRFFIKNMNVEGRDKTVLSNRYDEFFLNNDELPFTINSTLDDISNLLTSDPQSSVFIKIIDERYEEAMAMNSQIIESLNKRGVPNTSIKFKREFPREADNPFEGLFKNKVELYVESDKKIPGNNYYSFLVRKNTNIETLSQELEVPEEVLLEENSLSSRSISRNSIIRVWRPLTDPNMSILVNVSNFSYQPYRVKNGENVISIAEKLRLPEELIMEVNNLSNPRLIGGQVIRIYVRN